MMQAYSFIHSVITVIAIFAFGWVCWWAFHPKRRKRFQEDALIPWQETKDDNTHNHAGG